MNRFYTKNQWIHPNIYFNPFGHWNGASIAKISQKRHENFSFEYIINSLAASATKFFVGFL
jgi:hypothetical protein